MLELLKPIRQTFVSKTVLEKPLRSFQIGNEIYGRILDSFLPLMPVDKITKGNMLGITSDYFDFLVKHLSR